MNASTRLFGIGIVAATSFACSAHAMDLDPQQLPAGDGAPALTLPAFLDISRLPDMQDAWRLHSGVAATQSTKADDEAMETARDAMTRAEQITRDAAATRARAEELSRRFDPAPAQSSEPASQAPAVATETAPAADPLTETASIDAADAPADAPPLPPPAHVLGPGNDPLAAQDAASATEPSPAAANVADPVEVPTRKPAPKKKTAAIDHAPVVEDMATKPSKPAKRFSDAASARQINQAAAAKPTSPGLVVFEDSPTQPEHDPSKMLPSELRAFGWNAQP